MNPILDLTRDEITPTLRKFGEVMRRDSHDVVMELARRTTREVIAITPPASAGVVGRDAYNQGRTRIARQMHAVFAPVRLKRRRRERHPDVAGLYSSLLKASDARIRLAKFQGRKYYVDRTKFAAVLKERQGRVGRMASGWSAAAQGLNLAMPTWIARHGAARGAFRMESSGEHIRIRVTNFAPEARGAVRSEMARRLRYAMRYALAGMRRNIEAVTLRAAGRAGIKVLRAAPGASLPP